MDHYRFSENCSGGHFQDVALTVMVSAKPGEEQVAAVSIEVSKLSKQRIADATAGEPIAVEEGIASAAAEERVEELVAVHAIELLHSILHEDLFA